MSLLDDYVRVTRQRPCPLCARTKWCMVSRDDPSSPSTAICPRTPSQTVFGEAGYFHRLRPGGGSTQSWARKFSLSQHHASPELAEITEASFQRGINARARLAKRLHVSEESLRLLHVGWLEDEDYPAQWIKEPGAWTFPMRDATGKVIGVRLRHFDGGRFAITGSKAALFFEEHLLDTKVDQLVVAEGESDTAALLDWGLNVVGRPGCKTGTRHLIRLLRRLRPESLIVVADPDEPGMEGASALAQAARPFVEDVRVMVTPQPHADVRAWKIAGASLADFLALAVSTQSVSLQIRSGGRHDA